MKRDSLLGGHKWKAIFFFFVFCKILMKICSGLKANNDNSVVGSICSLHLWCVHGAVDLQTGFGFNRICLRMNQRRIYKKEKKKLWKTKGMRNGALHAFSGAKNKFIFLLSVLCDLWFSWMEHKFTHTHMHYSNIQSASQPIKHGKKNFFFWNSDKPASLN